MEPHTAAEANQVFNMCNTKRSIKVRKRASRACLCCRARKVRCDVSRSGRPCLNCRLDNETCIVTARARIKQRTTEYDSKSATETSLPLLLIQQTTTTANEEVNLVSASGSGQENGGRIGRHTGPCALAALYQGNTHDKDDSEQTVEDIASTSVLSPSKHKGEEPSYAECVNYLLAQLPESELPFQISVSKSKWVANRLSLTNANVVYCHYPFLTVPNIRVMPYEDLNFLEQQGCFRVPIRPILDDFIQQYFLRVHPFLPLLNEGDFWEVYGATDHPPKGISLLLLQAMLFTSCTFVSRPTICTLGFSDIRSMRATFLRRTKLLYNMGIEASPLVISQATLLLTFTSLAPSKQPEISWLSLAIENARLAEAHLYSNLSPCWETERNTLKRVWWCCIIRDRSIGLLLRHPIQITHDHFNFTTDPLKATDLSDEFNRSKVYNSPTKRRLADILSQWIELYILLTDILLLAYPLDGTYNSVYASNQKNHLRICACKISLERWHSSTTSRFPKTQNSARTTPGLGDKRFIEHNTTTLYMNFMYMYYHTSWVVLCHYEMLHVFLQGGNEKNFPHAADLEILLQTRTELELAISAITECHNELIRFGLIRCLPISAIGCTILPLALSVLDAKLSPQNENTSHRADATKRRQLITLVKVMQTYWPQYDVVDWIFEIVRYAVAAVQFDKAKFKGINWADMFASQPASYLRLALALDFSLSKGRLPRERDFPRNIKDVLATEVRHSEVITVSPCVYGKNYSSHTTCASNTPQGHLTNHHPVDLISPSKIESYPFGLDEAFVGNLEEQIHLHLASGFPDNGMSQFMEMGMSIAGLPAGGKSLSDADMSDSSLFERSLHDTSPVYTIDELQEDYPALEASPKGIKKTVGSSVETIEEGNMLSCIS
ncbi:fungal-specific transcription factor domain-containing protein [Trichoderma evansii]